MNDTFLQDRMARNNADYEGAGIGSGYYSAKEERKLKWENLKLPLVLSLFTVIVWVALIISTAPELDRVFTGTKVMAHREAGETCATWMAPDGKDYIVDVSWSKKEAGEIAVYYEGDNYRDAIAPMDWSYWALFYGFAAVVTIALGIWIKKILCQKKHAVPRTERSYKDY